MYLLEVTPSKIINSLKYNRIRLDTPLHAPDFLVGSNTRHNLIISKCCFRSLPLCRSIALVYNVLPSQSLTLSLSLCGAAMILVVQLPRRFRCC